MKMPNKISVVVPCYNSEKVIGTCVKSVLLQNPNEIIVVDDGSTDRTATIAKSLGAKVIKHKTNLGIAAARNTGVQAAKGDIVLFVDSDCEADRNIVKKILENYQKGVDGVGGRSVETGSSPADRWRQLTGGQGYGGEKKIGVPFLFGLCSSYRRSVLLEAGLFDETFRTNGEDVDMGLRLNKIGKTLVYAPGAKVIHYRRDTFWSLVRMVYRAYKFGYLAYLKNRGLLRTFRIFAASVLINLTKGLSIALKKSNSKLVHLSFVILAVFAEVLSFIDAMMTWPTKWAHTKK